MILHKDIKQRTPEWYEIKRGVLSASKYDKVITSTGKLANSEASRKFLRELVLECFVNNDPHKQAAEKKLSYDFSIQWGNDHEDAAREYFRDNVAPVTTVGFAGKSEAEPIGCSPDGLVPEGGNSSKWYAGLEIKCPALTTHVGYLEAGVLPSEYKIQVHGSMACTGIDRWYFMSYHPLWRRQFWILVERDEFTDKVEQAFNEFTDLYAEEYDRLYKLAYGETKEVAA